VRQPGIAENLTGLAVVVVMNQNPSWQDPEGAFDNAHVLVEHQVVNIGAIEQRADGRNQHDIIGPNQFPQWRLSFVGPTFALRRACQPHHALIEPLPHTPALSIVICEHRANVANVETCVAVIVPFESPSGASIDQLVQLVAADMERVNATILSRTGSEVTMIPEVANHLISSGGKRLRPMLTLAMAGLTGYSGDGHIKLAASVEFMHTATLLHDDVVDESELRRGKLSARMLWGNEASVLVGDFLLGQAFRMMVEVGSLRALDILSSAAATIAEGEVMQLAAAKNTATTEDEYLAVIRGKTAELFAAACEVGPVIANRPKAEQTACRSVGMNLGIAFQLVDDVLDYGGKAAKLGKNIGDDFREGKITLPVVLAFRRGNDGERAFWIKALERGEIGDGDLDYAIGLMTKHRALEDTINRAQHYGAMAVDALALFPASAMKTALEQVVAFCLARSH
jgi:octaprenyl-diphosphate synthase